ncbi:MAG TPA: hypothetical protein VIM16_00005 [Mucilaginibacter sp.]
MRNKLVICKKYTSDSSFGRSDILQTIRSRDSISIHRLKLWYPKDVLGTTILVFSEGKSDFGYHIFGAFRRQKPFWVPHF